MLRKPIWIEFCPFAVGGGCSWADVGGRVTPPAQRGSKENGKSKKKRCGKWKAAEGSKSTADDSEMVAAKREDHDLLLMRL